ncbi:MAG TPA: hypothetical protein VGF55_09575 [Gemmataceae bacterium]
MPDFRPLPDATLDAIAGKIGERLSAPMTSSALGSPPAATLNETMEVWMLGADALLQPTDDLLQLAKPTGRWHHQIKSGGQVVGYARSMPLGPAPGDWSVREVSKSGASKAIDDAIKWIDANVHDDSQVRMLSVPAYHVTAFWLVENAGDRIVVAVAPFAKLIQTNHIYTAKEFLDALRALPVVKGIS